MKNTKHWLITGSGIALLAVGFPYEKYRQFNNFLMNLPYVFVEGFGSGVLGLAWVVLLQVEP